MLQNKISIVKNGRTSVDKIFEDLVTLKELIELLRNNYSRSTIYRWVGQGMPHKKLGGKLWFPKREALEWLHRRFE